MAIRRCLTSSFRLFFTWRRAIAVQVVLIASLVAANTLMPEKRVTLQQALTVFRRLTQRSTEAIRSNSRMAWRCSGNTNEELVRNLERGGIFSSTRVREAMLAVDRGDFSPRSPYMDQPQGIGWNATISAPHMHAAALEYLKNHLVDGAYALDVGSGSGYLTVCMALMIGNNGKVVGIDHIPELVELAKTNTMKHHADLINNGQVRFVEGDGRKGYPMDRKYDAIHVGAAAETIPQPLIDQLAEGGRMLIPVGKESGNQVFLQVDKNDGEVTQKVIEHVIYVPLTSKAHQLGRYDL
ncbi:protein-L-isoaspartate O-methyltransferase [Necator americanus]|uniref:Protein-L-isoaspartate(D-aspartate) O-methyltransferase n=1 Tax=Necator americanus TaxID=51031 RepID=W2SL46_NECAM|nr:protein-L-isoaspartate O-methyltransferase [Necator americanus]ETN70389.1 protein-L-isoaspartate O-methyltransferase [Necator americanus]